VFAIPLDLLRKLEAREILVQLADDFALESTEPPRRPASSTAATRPGPTRRGWPPALFRNGNGAQHRSSLGSR
jgi:hypothetical protein